MTQKEHAAHAATLYDLADEIDGLAGDVHNDDIARSDAGDSLDDLAGEIRERAADALVLSIPRRRARRQRKVA